MRIAIVNSICVRHDAISESVLGTQRAVRDAYGYDPKIYCYAFDYAPAPHKLVENVNDLLFDKDLAKADLIIYHFGVYYELFNSIFLGSKAKRVVYYHNVTPATFLPKAQHELTARSVRQKANLAAADAIWAASRFNRDDLIDYGIDAGKISVEPLYLKFDKTGVIKPPKTADQVELLYIGRFVESKGLNDLIDAVAAARKRISAPFRLRLAGNLAFSDHGFLARLRKQVTDLHLDEIVSFEGQVSDTQLAKLYADADIFVLPSYHEGFCVPLIEALHARCVPLTYDAGNLAYLVGRWGVTVSTGDKSAFAAALTDLVGQFASGRPKTLRLAGRKIAWDRYDVGIETYLETFSFNAFSKRIVGGIERVMAEPAR